MLPVEIVELYLHEVPVVVALVVPLQQGVEDRDVAVVAEAQVAYLAGLFLLHEPVEQAILGIAVVKLLGAVVAHAHAVQQQVINIIDLQLLERVVEHLLSLLQWPGGGVEV